MLSSWEIWVHQFWQIFFIDVNIHIHLQEFWYTFIIIFPFIILFCSCFMMEEFWAYCKPRNVINNNKKNHTIVIAYLKRSATLRYWNILNIQSKPPWSWLTKHSAGLIPVSFFLDTLTFVLSNVVTLGMTNVAGLLVIDGGGVLASITSPCCLTDSFCGLEALV